jgi:hypothetical protein
MLRGPVSREVYTCFVGLTLRSMELSLRLAVVYAAAYEVLRRIYRLYRSCQSPLKNEVAVFQQGCIWLLLPMKHR